MYSYFSIKNIYLDKIFIFYFLKNVYDDFWTHKRVSRSTIRFDVKYIHDGATTPSMHIYRIVKRVYPPERRVTIMSRKVLRCRLHLFPRILRHGERGMICKKDDARLFFFGIFQGVKDEWKATREASPNRRRRRHTHIMTKVLTRAQ